MKYMIQHRLLPGENLLKKFENAKKVGFDGIELAFFSEILTEKDYTEIYDVSQKTDIKPDVVCGGYRGWIGHFDKDQRDLAISDIKRTMELGNRFGLKGIIAPAAVNLYRGSNYSIPKRESDEDEIVLLDSLKRIAEEAEKRKIYLYIEPLNRYEDHMINRVEQAVLLEEKTGSNYIKVMADVFHMNIEENNSIETLIKYKNNIKHIHLADSNRKQPGKGQIDFKRILSILAENKYDSYISFECGFTNQKERLVEIEESMSFLRI